MRVRSTRKQSSRKISLIVAALSFSIGLASLIVHNYRTGVCTAVNASGERVVIGTELTEAGKSYKRKFPADDNNAILEALGGRGPELAWTPESIQRCRITLQLSGALWIPLFGVAALASIFFSGIGTGRRNRKPARLKPTTFISYNHDDRAAVLRLKELLKKHDIDIILDTDTMVPGERISDFIRRSILECDVVVCVISSRSLLSAWVASETIGSLNRNKWGDSVMVIACYLNDEWFQPEFRLECTRQIDLRLQRIEELIPEYAAKKLDTADLNEEKSRLYDLRNNLGTILATFKDSLCLDIRDDHFEESSRRLVEAIRSRWSTRGQF